jgi:hypothetical protein
MDCWVVVAVMFVLAVMFISVPSVGSCVWHQFTTDVESALVVAPT